MNKKQNLLYLKNPELFKQIHTIKNEDIDLFSLTHGSNKKIWWTCKNNHKYFSSVNGRNMGSGCPYCSGNKVCIENCLATLNPELSKEWHPTKNSGLTPFDVTCGSNKYIWWICKKNHEFFSNICDRNNRKTKCPYCSNQKICIDNCLATLNPELANEWHPTKNSGLTPFDVTCNTNKKVWWMCKNGHEYIALLSNRNHKESKCSYCSGKKVCIKNCLAILKPELANEWHPTKNSGLTPFDVTCSSHKKIWWICEKYHEYFSKVSNRNNGKTSCPICNEPKGEKQIAKLLKKYNIIFERKKVFNDCKNKNVLPFDFYIPQYNLCIEHDGEQHYRPIDFFGGKKSFDYLRKCDEIKTKYCTGLKNRPLLLRIRFNEDIEEKLKDLLTKFSRFK